MAIDPSIITTVRADQLPVAPITASSILMHAVGETLYQALVSELISLIPSVNYKPYEVKWLNVTDLYIENNFDDDGLGLSDGDWEGWQIMNGNNGTKNFDGTIPLGWGASFNSMRQDVGENSKALVKNNIPKQDITLPVSDADNGGGNKNYVMATNLEPAGTHTYVETVNSTSTNTPVSIMQKSIVQLFIMKLP